MGSVGRTLCRLPGLAGYRNVGLWLPPFPSPAYFHTLLRTSVINCLKAPAQSLRPATTPTWPPSWRTRTMSAAALGTRKTRATLRRTMKKKKKTASSTSLASNTFHELYRLTGEVLGQGAYASVQTCVNIYTDVEYSVKIIDKVPTHSRARVFKEIDLFHHCQGHPNIIQLIEYFEETERFYLIFEKVSGGQLLDHIQTRKYFTEQEAANIIRDVASALEFLHSKGIAHRDLKPENVLCVYRDRLTPVKLCDFDLGSTPLFHSGGGTDTTPLLLTPVGSAEFMAPEIVEAFIEETEEDFKYDKRCDLRSLRPLPAEPLQQHPAGQVRVPQQGVERRVRSGQGSHQKTAGKGRQGEAECPGCAVPRVAGQQPPDCSGHPGQDKKGQLGQATVDCLRVGECGEQSSAAAHVHQQTGHQQQGLIHPGPGRPGANNNVSILLK